MALMAIFLFNELCDKIRDACSWKSSQTDIYNPKLLEAVDLQLSKAKFRHRCSMDYPCEEWVKIRPLQSDDYAKGFLDLMAELNPAAEISKEHFLSRFTKMLQCGDYYITVIEDTRTSQIIGSASLVTERKFYFNCGMRGRLEDLIIKPEFRGKQLGKLLAATVTLLAESLGCYKTTLDCKDPLVPFYESIGYVSETGNANSMNIRFREYFKHIPSKNNSNMAPAVPSGSNSNKSRQSNQKDNIMAYQRPSYAHPSGMPSYKN